MAITSAGIGSGLDVESIISGLMSVERQPLTAVTAQKTSYQSKISAFGTLKSALTTFQTSVSALSTASKFNAQTLTSSDTSVLTATSNGGATIGNYDITVSQLAKTQKLASTGFTNTSDVVGTGTMTISFGTYDSVGNTFSANADKDDVTITIDSSNNTLAGVRDAINAADASVSATIVNDGTTNRLVITSKDSGEVNSLKITVDDDDANDTNASGLSQLAFDPTATAGAGKNMTQSQAAKNAILNIDGIDIEKSSNTITDAIEGVTLSLLTTSSSAVSLGVASNQEAVKKSVTEFVDAYNKLDTTLRDLTKIDITDRTKNGKLTGDASVRSMISQLRSVMTQSVTTTGSIDSLYQIGVTFQQSGKLALDSTKLETAVASNFSDIAALFASTAIATDPQISFVSSTSKTQEGTYAVTVSQLGSSSVNAAGTINGANATGVGTNLRGLLGDDSEGLTIKIAGGALGSRGTVTYSMGYAAKLNNLIDEFLSEDGILETKTDSFNDSIKRLDTQAEALNARLIAREARYREQYTKLDVALASMNTTSSYLTQQIAAIQANS
jgi:flagellar hook-associated protein 2